MIHACSPISSMVALTPSSAASAPSAIASPPPEPAPGERLHRGLARRLETVRWMPPFLEGGGSTDHTQGLVWSRSALYSAIADDLFVRDHFLLRGISRRP